MIILSKESSLTCLCARTSHAIEFLTMVGCGKSPAFLTVSISEEASNSLPLRSYLMVNYFNILTTFKIWSVIGPILSRFRSTTPLHFSPADVYPHAHMTQTDNVSSVPEDYKIVRCLFSSYLNRFQILKLINQ